jgi:hypothetical protein
MKKLFFITGFIIILAACGPELKTIGETTSIDSMQDENLILNSDASLVSNKNIKQPGKHSSCRHYHKKKYE